MEFNFVGCYNSNYFINFAIVDYYFSSMLEQKCCYYHLFKHEYVIIKNLIIHCCSHLYSFIESLFKNIIS